MEQKAWKDIPGYGGRYQARMDGQVSRKYKNGKRKIFSQYTRKPAHGSKRYYVKLTDPETRKAKDEPVHQIVLKTFVGPCPEGCIPIHKNGIPEDNFLTNLCYMSKAAVGKKVGGKSKRKPVAKIDDSGEIVAFYSSAREAGRENHMSYQTIIDRCNGKVQGTFAPDGYAYSWDEDGKTEAVIRRIKALSEEIKSLRVSITGSGNGEIDAYKLLKEYKKTVLRCIEEAPSAYDTDAVKKKLENEYKDSKEAHEEYGEERLYGEMIAYKDAIKILENGGNKND